MIAGYKHEEKVICAACSQTGFPIQETVRGIFICDECQAPLDTIDARIALAYEDQLIGVLDGEGVVLEPQFFPTDCNNLSEFKDRCKDEGLIPILPTNLDEIIAMIESSVPSTMALFEACMEHVDPKKVMEHSVEILPFALCKVIEWKGSPLPAKMVYYLDRHALAQLPPTPGVVAFRSEIMV